MNKLPSNSDFDTRMHLLHSDAVASMSAATRSRLAQARHAAARPSPAHASSRSGWLLAATCAFALAIGLGTYRLNEGRPTPPASTADAASALATAAQTADDSDALGENPDLYVWLGSDTSLAME